ncbi:MAG: NHLP leader peptide family RiPP precursor [Rubrobacteraceae bacterium]
MTEASGGSPGGGPQQMRQRIVQRSVEDEEFRQRLLDDPKAAIEQEIGAWLPDEIEIRAVEETQDTVYLVLPPKPQDAPQSSELFEQELEAVAGGWGTSSTCDQSTCNQYTCWCP